MYIHTITRILVITPLVLFLLVACNTTYEPIVISPQSNTDSLLRVDSIATFRYLKIKEALSSLLNSSNSDIVDKAGIKSFYLQSNNEPVWGTAKLISEANILLQESIFHGLNPKDYGINKIDSLKRRIENDSVFCAQSYALLDIVLTKGMIKYTQHLLKGNLNPNNIYASWNFTGRAMRNSDSVIYSSILNNKVSELESLFEPKYMWYSHLKIGLRDYYILQQDIKEPLHLIYPGVVMRKGDSNRNIVLLKRKLVSLNLHTAGSITAVFDTTLEKSVKRFQLMHGLTPDGVPGVKTYSFLNWSISTYVEILQVNLERLRWLPNSFSSNYLTVNIPEYKLRLYSKNMEVFSSKVIVGKTKNKTPVFQSNIEYIVYNPCWTIPNSIATKKILPKLKKDSTYLDNHNMFICRNGKELASCTIDYDLYSQNNFPYKIFQRAGASNALGKVKFMFTNKYQVFLHDTPNKYLFNRDVRAFSSGCIRVQNALKLAQIIHFDFERNTLPLSYYLGKGYPEIVNLEKKVPIHILYLTCNSNIETGELYFYKDIYAKDSKVLRLLYK